MIKSMKKSVLFVCLSLMVFALTACGSSSSSVTEGSRDDAAGQEKTSEPDASESSSPEEIPEDSATIEPEDSKGDEDENDGGASASETDDDKGTAAILKAIWDTYKDDEKFAVGGGDASNMVTDGPGAYNISDTAGLDATLGFPESQTGNIDGAASLMHMMNANTFTGAAYHLKDKGLAAAVAEELEKNIQSRQWMCGFPDELLIFTVDDYIVSAFGEKDIMDTFKEKVKVSYENAEILYEEKIQE